MNNIDELLQHHGVKGMKWGVRRYQPYPKGSSTKGKFVGAAENVRSFTSKAVRVGRNIVAPLASVAVTTMVVESNLNAGRGVLSTAILGTAAGGLTYDTIATKDKRKVYK